MKTQEFNGSKRFEFSNIPGRPIHGHRWPPPGGPSGPMHDAVGSTIRAADNLDGVYEALNKDANLSDQGRKQAAQPQTDKLHQSLEDAKARVAVEHSRIAAETATAYAVPELDPTDAAGAILDREIRDRMASLSQLQLDSMNSDMAAGDQQRVLLALIRDPFPNASSASLFASELWKKGVRANKSNKLDALGDQQDTADWAQSSIVGLERSMHIAGVFTSILPPMKAPQLESIGGAP